MNTTDKNNTAAEQICGIQDEIIGIDACIKHHFQVYFQDLGDSQPSNLHQMMLAVCEKPLLELVMAKTRNNHNLL